LIATTVQKNKNQKLPILKKWFPCYIFYMKKSNTTWIELHHPAFEHNVRQLKKIIGAHNTLSVVVKGNAYGHGLIPIAQLCERSAHVDWLCTISLSEALTLREHQITKPILVLSFVDTDPALALDQSIDLVIQDKQTILWVHERAQALKKKARIHIKIDTGMSRLGFAPDKALPTIQSFMQLPYVTIAGIGTHFANTSNPASEQTQQQTQRFNTLLDQLEQHCIHIPIKHAANSAATVNHPAARHNFVRIGAAAYGLLPITEPYRQIPIATWKSSIAFMRTVDAGCFVGYDLTYQTTKKTTIAILPVGYYHGYSRRLSNIGTVLVRSATDNTQHYAPVIGRICMNHTMIDVTHIPNITLNDQVILMGPEPKVHPYDLAQCMQSFNPREVTTLLNGSIARIITY
jgi:alanine racemase